MWADTCPTRKEERRCSNVCANQALGAGCEQPRTRAMNRFLKRGIRHDLAPRGGIAPVQAARRQDKAPTMGCGLLRASTNVQQYNRQTPTLTSHQPIRLCTIEPSD